MAQGASCAYDGFAMIRFLFRFVGMLCLALGFILLVYDGTKSIADQRWQISTLRDSWTQIHESGPAQLQPAVERLAPWLWDPVVVTMLNAPTWLWLAIIGAILIPLGRKKRRPIGYARD